MPGDLCHFLTINLRHFQHLESMLECIVKEDLESQNMNERPSSQCTCDAVMGKEAKTHWIVPFFSVYIPFFVGFVFGFSQYLFLPSACLAPPSRNYLFEICMERICFCHAYLTFIPFCRPAGSIPCKDWWLKSPENFLSFSGGKICCVENSGDKYISKPHVSSWLSANPLLAFGGKVRVGGPARNCFKLTRKTFVWEVENWTYTSSRGYFWIIL